MFGIITAVTLTAISMLLIMLAVIQRRDYVHECEVDGWIAKRDRLNDEVYNLKDELAKLRHEYKEANSDLFDQCQQIRKYKDTVDDLNTECVRLQSEIQNLHSVYQRKLDDADEKLRLESQSFANEKAEMQESYDKASLELAELRIANYEKAKELAKLQDDVALLNRRLKDYDERIRASESARLIAESQMNSIREVCCGR